jgi:glycosyltransferase involved in cell wall biosynthesis
VRIGVDMYAAQRARGSPWGTYASELLRQLTTRFPDHQWLPHYHDGVPDGQFAMERSRDAVNLWLTTMVLDAMGEYIPPSAPLAGVPLVGLLHDLAPALVPDRFYQRPGTPERYRRSLLALPRYDLLLTVGEATRVECVRAFDIDASQVVTIGPAGDDGFFPADRHQPLTAGTKSALDSLGIRGPYVLCLASDDEDRSIAVWTAAVERLPSAVVATSQFVIACRIPERRQADWRGQFGLKGLTDRVLLVAPETDEARRLLYQQCEVLIDASPHEGSGLSLLHALQCGAAVVVDKRSPHVGLAGDAATFTDVDQPASLAAKLVQVLADQPFLASLRERAPAAARRFSMDAVANQVLDKLLTAAESGRREERERGKIQIAPARPLTQSPPHDAPDILPATPTGALRPKRNRPPLAFFSPLLPLRSGIADYSERLLAVLKDHYWIDLYHDHSYLPQLSVSSSDFACRDHRLFERFRRATGYAGIVYQMANTHLCGYLYEMLLKYPGVVVLHDYALPEFHFGHALRPGASANFIADEIAFESPELGAEYRSSAASWRQESGGLSQACLRRGLAFNRRVLEAAAVIVVHDRFGAERIASAYPHLSPRVRVVPHGASLYVVPAQQKPALRQRHGFAPDDLILSCFGFLNGAKYHCEVIEAVAAIIHDYPSVRLIFVGDDLNEGRDPAKVAELGLGEHVRFFGHAPMETFLELMSITDLAMNLRRPPTRGETSGALLTLLSAGVPTIVTDVDTFSSYPDAVVQKIRPLSPGDRSLSDAIRGLLARPERRAALGQAAVRYVAEIHNWQRVASLYADAIDLAREAAGARAA